MKPIEPFGYFRAEPFGWTACKETDDGAVTLYDQEAIDGLVRKRDELLDALDRLENAALSREITTGDPCNLIVVKGELDAARKHARAVILEVKGGAA